ncbi:MAG: hypothetical protein ACYC0C_04540 [Devosia sp.]
MPEMLHMDRAAALALGMLSGHYPPGEEASASGRLEVEAAAIRNARADERKPGAYLVCDGEIVIEEPNFEVRRDMDTFSMCIDALPKSLTSATFRPLVDNVIAGLLLSQSTQADRRVGRIGEVTFLMEEDRPIYCFSLLALPPRVSIAPPVGVEMVAATAVMAARLGDNSLREAVHLLIASFQDGSDALEAFIAAWAAIEMFVHVTFSETYCGAWKAAMASGEPHSLQGAIATLAETKVAKYHVGQKFLVISSFLDLKAADADTGEFNRLRLFRNELFHEGRGSPYPTDDVQKLALKYLRLHLLALARTGNMSS